MVVSYIAREEMEDLMEEEMEGERQEREDRTGRREGGRGIVRMNIHHPHHRDRARF